MSSVMAVLINSPIGVSVFTMREGGFAKISFILPSPVVGTKLESAFLIIFVVPESLGMAFERKFAVPFLRNARFKTLR